MTIPYDPSKMTVTYDPSIMIYTINGHNHTAASVDRLMTAIDGNSTEAFYLLAEFQKKIPKEYR